MALGIRILYPINVLSTAAAAGFLDYNNKYLVTDIAIPVATIRIKAKSYDNFGESTETPSITDPIAYIQISNDPNFTSNRTLTLSYQEDKQYDLSPLTGYTGTPTITNITAGDADFTRHLMRITNWVLDTGEDLKVVYVRFITGGMIPYYFPDPSEIIKGYFDNIIVVKIPPVIPQNIEIENKTTNNYVAKTTTVSWLESEDNISGLRGYLIDAELTNDVEILEECNNLDDFKISDATTIAYNLANDLPVMRVRKSVYAPGEYTFTAIPGQSKLEAVFSKTGATVHGHELQYENNIPTDVYQGKNYTFEAKLKPMVSTGADGTVYYALQNFDALYTNGNSAGSLDCRITVTESGLGLRSLSGQIIVDSINGFAPYYDLKTLSGVISVVPTFRTDPLYVDLSTVATNVNNWSGAGSDFILVEIDEDGTYRYIRPTWDGNELLTGYTTTTYSSLPFAESITPNDVNQEIEMIYRENRADLNIVTRDGYGWNDILSIDNIDRIWQPESFTILWQKIRTNHKVNFDKIQVMIESFETRERPMWFNLILTADGSLDPISAVTGLPWIVDDITELNRKNNFTGIKEINYTTLWNSCSWNDGDLYPQFNVSKYRRWNETVMVQPGRNIITFARKGFTNTSVNSSGLDPANVPDLWIGLAVVGIQDNITYTTEGTWEFSSFRPNIAWNKIDKSLDGTLPESSIMARNLSVSLAPLEWVSEYKATIHTTDPAMLRFMTKFGIPIYSIFPEDMNGTHFDLIVSNGAYGLNGIYTAAGTYGGQPLYENTDGSGHQLYWDGGEWRAGDPYPGLFTYFNNGLALPGTWYYNNSSITVVGAGNASYNGVYVYDPAGYGGKALYTKTSGGTCYLYWCSGLNSYCLDTAKSSSTGTYSSPMVTLYIIAIRNSVWTRISALPADDPAPTMYYGTTTGAPVVTRGHGTYSELILNWNQVGADSISRLINEHHLSVPVLKGLNRHALTGVRLANIAGGDQTTVTYDDLRFSDNSIITSIDLSDDVGYEKQTLDQDQEEKEKIAEQTVWTTTDWNRTWTRYYGVQSDVVISINADQQLVFGATSAAADSVDKSAETHYYTPTNGKSCEVITRVDLKAETLDTEFYVAILPSQYESDIWDVKDNTQPGTPSDMLIFGFRYNGDIYLYRPRTDGDVVGDLIHTLGSFDAYSWQADEIKIRINNDSTASMTGVVIWHGSTVLYSSTSQPLFIPESDQGFWVSLGFHNLRKPEATLRLDVGNFKVQEVNPANPNTTVGAILYGESMQAVINQWFTSPGIGQISLAGGVIPTGSWFVGGVTSPIDANVAAKYSYAHRIAATYNVMGHPDTSSVDPATSIGPLGVPDMSRFAMYANVDDVLTVPELSQIQRWIGPYLILDYNLAGVESGRAYRFDFNYTAVYPETTGASELIFGISNWLPTNAAATTSPYTIVQDQDYAVYSFIEDDLSENTKGTVYALDNTGATVNLGTADGQYVAADTPRYGMFSFLSDGKIHVTKGRLTNTIGIIDPAVEIGDRVLPASGKMSIVIYPKNTAGTLLPQVVLTSSSTNINLGESVTLTWTSTNATSVYYTNFGTTSVNGSLVVSPTQSTDYTIVVANASDDRSTATMRVDVGTTAAYPVINSFIANPNSTTSGQTASLSWDVSNPGSGALTVSLNGGVFTNQSVQPISSASASPLATTTYTLTASNSSGSTSRQVTVTIVAVVVFTVQLTGNVSSITSGGNATLTWTSAPSGSVTLVSSNFGATSPSGSTTVSPTSTTVYTIRVRYTTTGEEKESSWTVAVGGYTSGTHQSLTSLYYGVRKVRATMDYNYNSYTFIKGYQAPVVQSTTFNLIPVTNSIPFATGEEASISDILTNTVIQGDGSSTYYYTATNELRIYPLMIPGPWLPGNTSNIISGALYFTTDNIAPSRYMFSAQGHSSNILNTYFGVISESWDASLSHVPSMSPTFNSTPLGLSAYVNPTTQLTINSNMQTVMTLWNNSGYSNYGIFYDLSYYTLSLPPTFYNIKQQVFSGNIYMLTSGGGPYIPFTAGDAPKQYIYNTFAGPTHPTPQWRPYWIVTYQSVGVQSIRTMAVSMSEVEEPAYQMVSMSTVTPPQYFDVSIYVDDTLYATETDIPLNFNTTDGTRLFVGARRKSPGDQYQTSATISKFAINYVNDRSQPNDTSTNDLALWSKTGGILPANTLFYARNVDVFQDEEYDTNLIGTNSMLAQAFIPAHQKLQAISLKIKATSSTYIIAHLCAANTNNLPTLTPVNNHISLTDSNIISSAWCRTWPGMEEAFFIFNTSVTLTVGTMYYVIFDYLTSAYGSGDVRLMPLATAKKWDGSNWIDLNAIAAFRVCSDIYVNIFNELHAQTQNYKVAATNNAGLTSAFTNRSTNVTTDLLPPHKPSVTTLPPILYLTGGTPGNTYVTNYGALLQLTIGAQDTDVIGSGVQDFRIVYWGNFDELLTTDFYQWNDPNADNYIDMTMLYNGTFLDTKKFYAQVRDKVGNMIDSNELYVTFKYSFFEDTEPPYLTRIRIEGDATIDPDPNEALVTNTIDNNTSLYVLDRITGCKDFRINHDYATDSITGKLIYNVYQPYVPNFITSLTGNDGIYAIMVQARDYGDNATQEFIEHIKTIDFSSHVNTSELPTVVAKYKPQFIEYLYIGSTKHTSRMNLTCISITVSGYSDYTVYEVWSGSTQQTFKLNETITVKVNGIVVADTEYDLDYTLDTLTFHVPLSHYDTVTMDIVEEVAVLYRYENGQHIEIKRFDNENERSISAMVVYNSNLYLGMDSGRIYIYNGVKTSSSIYRVTDTLGNYIPVSCMFVSKFNDEDRDYLYVGTFKSAQVFRYGGNVADTSLTWTRLTTITNLMTADTDVYDFEFYNDLLFIATGPYGKVYKYNRSLNNVGVVVESISSTQLYSEEFANNLGFRLNVLCLQNFDDKVFAGADYNSSIFSYLYLSQSQPRDSEWTELYSFNKAFDNNPNPWEFYNQGNVDPHNTNNLSFVETYDDSGKISDWYMLINGNANEYCLWINRDSGSAWQAVKNTTGWMIDFQAEVESFSDANNSYQGLQIYDGTYELEFRIYANNSIEIISGVSTKTYILPIGIGMRRYRINVKGTAIQVYVDNSNEAAIDEVDFLVTTTQGKSILFGKTDVTAKQCNVRWKNLYYYINGILTPLLVVERDFLRDQVLPFGKEIRYLLPVTEIPINKSSGAVPRLIAGVEPRDPATFTIQDDPTTLIPRTYVRESGDLPVWSLDARYDSTCSAIVDAIIWNNLVISISEVSSNLLTNIPFNRKTFMVNIPIVAMIKNGDVFYRRRTQSYDTIIKDTAPPLGSIIINEDTSAGSVQVYAMESYDSTSKQIKQGYTARYSALDIEVDSAYAVIDGDNTTYDVIGTPEIRYVKQTFTDDPNNPVSISKFRWGCKSNKQKTYNLEYLSTTNVWVIVAEMISDSTGDQTFFEYTLTNAISAMAVRIIYTGDYETVSDASHLTLAAHDMGIGVTHYRVSGYQDFRDSYTQSGADINGWIPMTDGIITIDWNLISANDDWQVTASFAEPLIAAIEYNGILVVSCRDKNVYISSNGTSFVVASTTFTHVVNCFAIWRDTLYLGTDGGVIYESDNGLDWNLTTTISGVKITSLAAYNDTLYIGTGNSGKFYTYDGTDVTLVKQFSSAVISSLFAHGTLLHIGLSPTGEIFKFDGTSYYQTADVVIDQVNQFNYYLDKNQIYAACGHGKIYTYVNVNNVYGWQLLFDSSVPSISGLAPANNEGPEILSISDDGAGLMSAGTWRYKITYINNAGTESSAGPEYVFESTTVNGKLALDWQAIDNAVGYRIYRCPLVNDGEDTERLMEADTAHNNIITGTTFADDGAYPILSGKIIGKDSAGKDIKEADISPPVEQTKQLWFSGSSAKAYVYDGISMSEIALPSQMNGANGIIQYKGQMYLFGQTRPYTSAEIGLIYNNLSVPTVPGKMIKYTGISVGSGYKNVYCQFKDGIDNVTDILSDKIFYNNLISKHVIEVNTTSNAIVDSYESISNPPEQLYSAFKSIEQTGVYESEPYFAANLSRWDVIDLIAQLPYDTIVDLYVRTATSRDGLETAAWNGPFELLNPNIDYDYYYRYGYYYEPYFHNYYYEDYSYYIEDQGEIMSLSSDISYLSGQWIQFKLVLRTENRSFTPKVFSIVIKYISNNAAMFYTTVFDLRDIASHERVEAGTYKINRGILTWEGVIPPGGDIQFGVSTKNLTSYSWGDYQIVTPNHVFTMDDPQETFRVAALLISTDTEVAIIDEWAILIECENKDVKINLNQYI